MCGPETEAELTSEAPLELERLEELTNQRLDEVESRERLEMVESRQDLELNPERVRGHPFLVGLVVAADVDEGSAAMRSKSMAKLERRSAMAIAPSALGLLNPWS